MKIGEFAAWLVSHLDCSVKLEQEQLMAVIREDIPGTKQYAVIYARKRRSDPFMEVWENNKTFLNQEEAQKAWDINTQICTDCGTAEDWIRKLTLTKKIQVSEYQPEQKEAAQEERPLAQNLFSPDEADLLIMSLLFFKNKILFQDVPRPELEVWNKRYLALDALHNKVDKLFKSGVFQSAGWYKY